MNTRPKNPFTTEERCIYFFKTQRIFLRQLETATRVRVIGTSGRKDRGMEGRGREEGREGCGVEGGREVGRDTFKATCTIQTYPQGTLTLHPFKLLASPDISWLRSKLAHL